MDKQKKITVQDLNSKGLVKKWLPNYTFKSTRFKLDMLSNLIMDDVADCLGFTVKQCNTDDIVLFYKDRNYLFLYLHRYKGKSGIVYYDKDNDKWQVYKISLLYFTSAIYDYCAWYNVKNCKRSLNHDYLGILV